MYWILLFFIGLLGMVTIALGFLASVPELMPDSAAPGFPWQFLSSATGSLHQDFGFLATLKDSPGFIRVLFSSSAAFLLSMGSSLVFLRFFRKITASQLLFLFVFLAALAGELIKPIAYFLALFGVEHNLLVLVSRVHLSSYFLGVFSLFLISLYHGGIKFQHQGGALLGILALSLLLGQVFPLSTHQPGANFLYAPTQPFPLLLVALGIGLVSVTGLLIFIIERFNRVELLRLIALVLIFAGFILLSISTLSLAVLLGFGMLAAGVSLYYIRLFYDFFWY